MDNAVETRKIVIGWPAAVAVIAFTVSTTWAISTGLNNINNSVKDVRSEMHAAIDSVKSRQMQRGYQTDANFQRLESKIDALAVRKR